MRDALVQFTRYYIAHTEYADDWREGGLKKPDDLNGIISWYMRNVTRWITERDGRYFLSDVRKAIGGGMDRRRIDRLLKALNTVLKDITEYVIRMQLEFSMRRLRSSKRHGVTSSIPRYLPPRGSLLVTS
jgi:hypothetical protein